MGIVTASCGSGSEPPSDAVAEQSIGIMGPGGWLQGTAHAAGYTGIAVPLPDAAVYAQNILTMVNTLPVLTDFYGGFRIPVDNGKYKLCWTKSGYTSACGATIYTVNNKSHSVGALALTIALPQKVRGSSLLADGSACLTVDKFMGTEIAARAELLNATNGVVYTTRLNFRGEWVLPNPGNGSKVRVTCGKLSAEAATSSMSPTAPFKLNLPNRRPSIRPISATAGGLEATKGVLPGTTIQLATTATDPDGDRLVYRWRAAQGTLGDTGTPNAQWTVPSIPGTFLAYLSADDGKGGYSTRTVSVRVRTDPRVIFSGNVRDDSGAVLAGATVTVGTMTTTSDAAGHFSMIVSEADNYLLNITKVGYAEYSRPMRRPGRGQRYTLARAFAKAINPTVDNLIVDQRDWWLRQCPPKTTCPRTPGRVMLPANSLNLTPPPVGGLTAYIATYDANAEALPGDQGAINSAGQPVALGSFGALFIEIRDSVGTKYNLAAGKTARIDIPFQSQIASEGPPATMDMWKYHPETGLWSERATAGVKNGSYYSVDVPNFSTQNADIEKVNPSCLYVDVEDDVLADHVMHMKLQVPVSVGGAVRVYEKPLDESRNVIYNLPTGLSYTLEIFESVGATKVLKQPLTGLTGPAWGGVGNPGLSEPDCVIQTVKFGDVVGDSGAFSNFLERKNVGDLAQAKGYYKTIDPRSDPLVPTPRETLGGFWEENGFDGNPLNEVRTTFINFSDLGFGRDMHCRKDPITFDVACYVTNYGAGDQAPGNYDLAKAADTTTAGATVAMEYSPGPGGTKIVKFYAYGGGDQDSPRIESANLDGAGEKYIPNLCLNCHGGSYQPNNPNDPTSDEVNMGSSFREFDIHSYRDGTLGDKPNELASGLHEIVNMDPSLPPLGQQTKFLQQNQLVLATAPEAAIGEIINLWYPNSVPPFAPNVVPQGWDIDASTRDLYLKVVAKYCRTCHIAQENVGADSKAWATYDQFKTYGLLGPNGLIPFSVCYGDEGTMGTAGFDEAKRYRFMPHTNVTFKNFWLDPNAYNTLGNYTGPGWSTKINDEGSYQCSP
jgi:hypothetical protein